MLFTDYNKILVGTSVKELKKASYTGKLNLNELLLFEIVGNLLYNNIYNSETEKIKLENILNIIKNTSNFLCKYYTINETFLDNKAQYTFNTSYIPDNGINSDIIYNTAPVISDISFLLENSYEYTFNKQLFINAFTDVDNDLPSKLKIVSLPSNGVLKYNNIDIILNQEINIDDINLLKYIQTSYSITDIFTFMISDDNQNPLYSNMATFTLNIQNPINQKPISTGVYSLTLYMGIQYIFTLDNFTTETNPPYIDPEGDAAYKIKITQLPTKGILQRDGTLVYLNQEILLLDVSSGLLSYTSPLIEGGGADTDNFTFDISDTGSSLYLSGGRVDININEYVNNAPTIGDAIATIDEGVILIITKDMLTTLTTPPYNDPEGDLPLKLRIDSLPINGILKLDGNDVIVGQEILFTDIDNNLLTYTQDVNSGGTVEGFTFSIQDTGSGEYSS